MAFDMVQDLKNLKNLPDRWKVLNFDEVIEDNTRNADKIQKNDYLENGKIAIVDQGQNLVAGYSNDEANAYNKYPLIIFGDHTRILKYIDFPIYLGADGTKLLDVKKEIADTKYVYYFLKTLNIPNTGYNRHFKYLKDIRIPLPPLNIQKKIADTLDKAQELIDKRKEQISALDKFLESLFLDMFGDPVSNPMGWEKVKLESVCSIIRGASPRPIEKFLGGTVPWIKIGDGTRGNQLYLYDTKEKIIEEGVKKSRYIKKGGLIFANCGVSLGFARILKIDGCIHDGWLAFENISENLNKIFLLKLLNYYTDYFRKTAPDGTQPNLNTGIMKKFDTILPPFDLQNQFASIVEKVEAEKTKLEASLKEMEDNFNSIMQRAFKGELF